MGSFHPGPTKPHAAERSYTPAADPTESQREALLVGNPRRFYGFKK